MPEINLLEKELAIKKTSSELASKFKSINLVLTLLFFVGCAVVLFFFFNYSSKLKVSLENQQKLRSEIKAMERIEQQYVLVKDRTNYLKEIGSMENIYADLKDFDSLVAELPEGAAMTDVKIAFANSKVSFNVDTTKTLSELLSQMVANDVYKDVVLTSFQYGTTDAKYQISFDLIK